MFVVIRKTYLYETAGIRPANGSLLTNNNQHWRTKSRGKSSWHIMIIKKILKNLKRYP